MIVRALLFLPLRPLFASTTGKAGQKLHLDSGKNGRPASFGTIHEDHEVPLSALIPLTAPVKLDVNKALTRIIAAGKFDELEEDELKMYGNFDIVWSHFHVFRSRMPHLP